VGRRHHGVLRGEAAEERREDDGCVREVETEHAADDTGALGAGSLAWRSAVCYRFAPFAWTEPETPEPDFVTAAPKTIAPGGPPHCSPEVVAAFERFVDFYRELFRRPAPLRDAKCRDSYKAYVPKYYRKVFGPEVRGVGAVHYKWLRRLAPVLSLPRGARIVDIGGGYGFDSILLAALGYDLVFYELSPHHLAVCEHLTQQWQAQFGPLALRTVLRSKGGDPQELARKNASAIGQVDAVLLDEVAHHIEPTDELFRFCARVVRPGGRLFLLEPNFWSPVVQAVFFRVRGFRVVKELVDEDTGEKYQYGHEHIRTPSTWRKLAAAGGFELVGMNRVVPFGMRAAPSMFSPWRRALERTPFVRALLATHITFEFARPAAAGTGPS
jgi:SAM-dependent methyltransferase